MTRVAGSVAVVTGGASGIGRALAQRFVAEGARAVVIADRHGSAAAAAMIPGTVGIDVDVTDEAAVRAFIEHIESSVGPIDVYCSNAGISTEEGLGGESAWAAGWGVHVMAHVYVARHLLPRLLARDSGHIMITASAAGLLSEPDSAAYTVTKHGAVAFAEWLAIAHGGTGVSFSCLCPQGVRTPMTAGMGPDSAVAAAGAFLEPAQVADAVVAALAAGTFLILPHPEVADFERRRAADRDRWLAGMRRALATLRSR